MIKLRAPLVEPGLKAKKRTAMAEEQFSYFPESTRQGHSVEPGAFWTFID